MKHFIRLIAFFMSAAACSPQGDGGPDAAFIGTGYNPNPLTFWWYAADPTVIRPALECALGAIREATCLPVDISFDAHHWVRQVPQDAIPGKAGATQGSSWDSTRIKVLNTLPADYSCGVLKHEIAQHVLRRSNSHIGADSEKKLTAPLLESVCSLNECECFNPEG